MNPVSYPSSSDSTAAAKVLNRHSHVMEDRDESVKGVGAARGRAKKFILD